MSQQEHVTYELSITAEEASSGGKRLLTRNGKRLEVRIPPGVNTGSIVKLTNALQVTDGHPGDIIIKIVVKERPLVPAGVIEVADSTFDAEVLAAPLPVVVDFWAPWCGPCRIMAPVMEKLAQEYQKRCKFCKINVDENPQMAAKYQAMSIPLLIFFKNGNEVDRSVGAVGESAVRSRLEALL